MDTDAFTNLLRSHAGLIHKIAYAYCRQATDREDLLQEIAIQLWRSRDRYDTRFKETTWIYRIAMNVAISFHRRYRRHEAGRVSLDAPAFAIVASSNEPSEDIELLQQCIDGLSELNKALVLLYLDGQDHASIAEVLGLSVSNVGTKLQRIKNELRVVFDQRKCSNPTENRYAT